jgi:TonB family protein
MKIYLPDAGSYESFSKNQSTQFTLTLLPDAPLSRRLSAEIDFAVQQFKNNWPKFKDDPFGSIRFAARHVVTSAKQTIARPQTAFALMTSVLILTSAIVGVLVIERRGATRSVENEPADLSVVTTLKFDSKSETQKDVGIGAGEKGRVGFERGKGEGSLPTPARAHGGGGGGTHSLLAASQGRPPIPSIIPAPIPTAAVRLPRALPVAGIDLDPALWRKLDYSSYGDPRTKSVEPSNGSGDGGGVGTGKGPGIGEGDGPGFGRGFGGNIGGDGNKPGGGGIGGSHGNDPNDDDRYRVYPPRDVSTRPRVISKPEPQYTEQARRDQITGTVVLRVIFSSSGDVTNINAVQKLGGGLTEKAIAAAHQIRFVPATRNGHPVSMYMQLEYNFNLY